MTYWLPGATVVDLSATHGYGPFQQPFLGVVAHVNQGSTSDAFFAASTDVCPNFQVYADGSIHQYLPLNWQPWCQTAGNQQYAAIESAGYNTDPWTNAQLSSVALILAAYRDQLGLQMTTAEAPGQRGFGWHGMGGVGWGNHPGCPGEPRKAQRQAALTLAAGLSPSGGGTPIGDNDLTPDEHQMLVNCQNALHDLGLQILQPGGTPGGSGRNTAYTVDLTYDAVNALASKGVTATVDVDALATALIAKLPATGLTKQDVTDACELALAGTPLIVSATIGAKTS